MCDHNSSVVVVATTVSPYYVSPCGAPCNASVAPTDGGAGDCTSSFHGTCQPTCTAGYAVSGPSSCSDGTLTAASCTAEACPAHSLGDDVPAGCTCNAGYNGTITASTTSPYYSGDCQAVSCPAHSFGGDVPAGCTCNAGYSGTITASTTSPYYSGDCQAVSCLASDSAGSNVPAGCTCNAGYSGTITAS